jgi:hypothetical protein
MVTGGLIKKTGPMENGAAFWVLRGKNKSAHAGETYGASAHCTGLERYEKVGRGQAFVLQDRGRRPKDQHLSMSRGVT